MIRAVFFKIIRMDKKKYDRVKFNNKSSRYRILFPRPDDKRKEIENVTHWIFSMNGLDFMIYYKDGKKGRGFSRHKEFPSQWEYVNDLLKTD